MSLRPCLVFVAAMVAATAAGAQTIYRCGNEYTRVPCSEGKAVDTDNSALAKRAAEGRQVALRDRRLADEMVRDRHAREAELKPARATSLGPAKAVPPPAAASAGMKAKKKAKARIRGGGVDGDFIAAVPKAKKT